MLGIGNYNLFVSQRQGQSRKMEPRGKHWYE